MSLLENETLIDAQRRIRKLKASIERLERAGLDTSAETAELESLQSTPATGIAA